MPGPKPIFFDPEGKRWRRLRLVIDTSVIVVTLLVAFFVVTVFRGSSVPGVPLQAFKKPYHPLKEVQKRKTQRGSSQHTAPKQHLTPVALNSLEGIRGAFYVQWDAASFASLKEYYPQIDLLFPEWLHVLTADGRLQSVTETNVLFDLVAEQGHTHPVDD
jgi:hypothetical protein